ncbi:MAG: phosphoglycolate phosphatase-like HAD superfamily hydrolase [Paraglaciecola sp.]|jgi:phosphoglycolate phosphatase-like HAD superfamily hydrolase
MKQKITDYITIVFDCDGVVLNSNKVKTEAFYQAALPYGKRAADELVKFHVENGGVSRYKKFAYFLDSIVPSYSPGLIGPSLNDLLQVYAKKVRNGLIACDVAESLQSLRDKTIKARWLIVSGGDQLELRDVFSERDLINLFDGGIFGSPDNKDDILSRELDEANIKKPALFIGDSKYDYSAAKEAGLDFVYMHKWTEVREWEGWCKSESIVAYATLSDLLHVD